MSELDAELTDIFRDEAAERLDQMDAALLAVESGDAHAESVDSLFRNAHTIKGAAGMLGFDDIRSLAHAVEDVLAGVRQTKVFPPELAAPMLRATAVLRAQVAGAEEPIDGLLDELAASAARFAKDGGPSGAIVPEQGVPRAAPAEHGARAAVPVPSELGAREAVSVPAELGAREVLPVPGELGAREVVPAPSENGAREAPPSELSVRAAAPAPSEHDAREALPPAPRSQSADLRQLRVPAKKIDRLLDVVGEVMQYRGRLAHSLGGEARLSPAVADVLSSGEQMLDELKDTAIGMRTLPLSVITRRLPLAVRDLAHTAGKDVEFIVTGADTEIDRVILESLYDPLAHLLRNAVIHGIESPAERARAHKPVRGRLEVRAMPHGSLVEIVVSDDGQGVSPEVIAEAEREGSLADVLARAGYSTAEEVSELAGRGVGLDVVMSYARAVGGSLEVRSTPGQGMDVILLLPLAVALLEVLLFERGTGVYGVPMVAVEEIVMLTETLTLEGRPALEVRGRTLPVADVAVLVGAAAPPLVARSPALVISAAGRRAVASCDAVLGEEEVVIKPLSPLFGDLEGYLGTAILGDGRIALLVEPAILASGSRLPPRLAALPVSVPALAPKILVAEDSFTVRELQRSILEAAGYPVVTARDGREALAILSHDSDIALVVTDLEMPEVNGLELTRAIRADAAHPSLPVVIITSLGSEEDMLRGAEAGADAYMAKKGFDQQILLATVNRLVGR
jgi:two-component system, chemotaxis family, sensor kinase CheA